MTFVYTGSGKKQRADADDCQKDVVCQKIACDIRKNSSLCYFLLPVVAIFSKINHFTTTHTFFLLFCSQKSAWQSQTTNKSTANTS